MSSVKRLAQLRIESMSPKRLHSLHGSMQHIRGLRSGPRAAKKKTAMRMRRGGPPVTLLHICIRSVPIGFAAFVLKTVDPTQLQKFWGHEGAHDTDLTEQPVGIDGSSTWPPQVTVLQQAHEAHGLVPPPQLG
jgi:hypothetical protein